MVLALLSNKSEGRRRLGFETTCARQSIPASKKAAAMNYCRLSVITVAMTKSSGVLWLSMRHIASTYIPAPSPSLSGYRYYQGWASHHYLWLFGRQRRLMIEQYAGTGKQTIRLTIDSDMPCGSCLGDCIGAFLGRKGVLSSTGDPPCRQSIRSIRRCKNVSMYRQSESLPADSMFQKRYFPWFRAADRRISPTEDCPARL